MPLEAVLQDVWAEGAAEEEYEEYEEEEDEEEEEEEEDMSAFWQSVKYKCRLGETETGELVLVDMQKMIQSGEIQDETTPMQVQGPDGQWEAWSTMGEIIADYDGFEEALFMAVEVGAMVYEEPMEEEEDDDDDDPVAHWVHQSFEYKRADGSNSHSVCVGELQELLKSGEISEDTKLFSDEFDDFESIASARGSKPGLGAALDGTYWQSLRYEDAGGQLGADVPIVKVRQLVREEAITDETMVMAGDMAAPQPLGRVRVKLGLAAWMEPLDDDGGIEDTELQREATEETKAKLSENLKETGKTASGMMKMFKNWWGGDPKEKARKEAEKKKKKAEAAKRKKKRERKKKKKKGEIAKLNPEKLMRTPAKSLLPVAVGHADAKAGELQLQEGFFKKFKNRTFVLVEVDAAGKPIDLGLAAAKPGFRRCVLIYDGPNAKKPSCIAESMPDGKFKLTTPQLDKKVKKKYPHSFALHAIDPAAILIADDVHVVAADTTATKGKWATMLTEGLKSATAPEAPAKVDGMYHVSHGDKVFQLKVEATAIELHEGATKQTVDFKSLARYALQLLRGCLVSPTVRWALWGRAAGPRTPSSAGSCWRHKTGQR